MAGSCKQKPLVAEISPTRRIVSLPFTVDEGIVKAVAAVEGVTFTYPNPWGKYEFGYDVGACFEPQLVDHNVAFVMDEYAKEHVKA